EVLPDAQLQPPGRGAQIQGVEVGRQLARELTLSPGRPRLVELHSRAGGRECEPADAGGYGVLIQESHATSWNCTVTIQVLPVSARVISPSGARTYCMFSVDRSGIVRVNRAGSAC